MPKLDNVLMNKPKRCMKMYLTGRNLGALITAVPKSGDRGTPLCQQVRFNFSNNGMGKRISTTKEKDSGLSLVFFT